VTAGDAQDGRGEPAGFGMAGAAPGRFDLEAIRIVECQDDRRAYLALRYKTGVEAPSWTASDGTLRLLALTLIA